VVSIVTLYGLDGSGIRTPVGAKFSSPVRTGCGAHPAAFAVSTGSFAGVKQPELGVNHPSPSSAECKERVEVEPLYSYGVF
jgi:hypothetical protein